jgi:cytochrome c-type biogenesis protein CcsB
VEQLSLTAKWVALGATAAAVLFYWAYVFGGRLVLGRLATPGQGVVTLLTWERLPDSLGRLGTAATWAALAAMTVSLAARWQATGYPPWANMWEFTSAFTGAIMLFYIIFERWYGQRALGAVVQPLVLGLLASNLAFFPSEVRPLVPALQSRGILAAHVGVMVLAYAALSISFAAAVLHLAQGEGRRFSRLPPASLLDEIAFRSVVVGFPLLALGIALGAYWGNSAWGRYWGWDPKETSALVTWLIYGVYLHLRSMRGWRGRRSALALVVAYMAVLFTYFGVNLAISGLHSYAGV